MKKLFLSFVALLILALPANAKTDNYTVIISMDGCRWDYPEMYDTPFFNRLGKEGVKAVMRPSFPSKTFPNHYTLATGLYPDHHGIIANSFLDVDRDRRYSLSVDSTRNDVSYYGGEPIWITAQRQGLKTATVYWVGSDIPICRQRPTYWHNYQEKRLTFDQRADRVVELLSMPADKRPRLVMAYFEEPDHNGHVYGPQSRETRKAIEHLDSLLCSLWSRIKALPIGDKVNLIVTSDHGMAALSPDRQVDITKVLKRKWYRAIEGDLPAMVYTVPQYTDSVLNAVSRLDHVKCWKKEQVPAYLHYGSNRNIGEIVVLPDLGWLVTSREITQKGSHGFDPYMSDMQVLFRAVGPDFKKGYEKTDRFTNVNVYSLLARLLGITPAPNDGDISHTIDMLQRAK